MEKLTLKRVYIDPKDGYKLVDETDQRFFKDTENSGYLKLDDAKIQRLTKTFMVDSENATNPIWFKKLKEAGITITAEGQELEVEHVEHDEYSYRHEDRKYTKVSEDKVLTDEKGFYALIDGVVYKLYKRSIKKYTINGINVGNEYQFNKLLGLDQPDKSKI